MGHWCENPVEYRPPLMRIGVRVRALPCVRGAPACGPTSSCTPHRIIAGRSNPRRAPRRARHAPARGSRSPGSRMPHRHRSFLGTTPAPETSVVRRKVGSLRERAAARADSLRALLSHLEPLRVLPVRRLPADSSFPGHIFKPTRPGGGGWETGSCPPRSQRSGSQPFCG